MGDRNRLARQAVHGSLEVRPFVQGAILRPPIKPFVPVLREVARVRRGVSKDVDARLLKPCRREVQSRS